MQARVVSFLSLFTSLGTLLCCALPALLVSLGLGAVVAGIVSEVPALIWLSERKPWVFGLAGLMILIAGTVQWYSQNLPCPVDPVKAKACDSARRWSKWTWIVSLVIYVLGASVAFLPEIFSG